ncbi:MAG: dephospho-CoA kinase, partial [Verrucomicrobiae bacterium]|nr:dephospho-CoA kinase [Verrucomicrobiae bacterium]
QGFPVIQTDRIGHDLLENNAACRDRILQVFGPEIVGPDQKVSRTALGRKIFSSPPLRSALNDILHPLIRASWTREAARLLESPGTRAVFVEIPLLFESGAQSEFHSIITVACSPDRQISRLRSQRLLSEEEARSRLEAQLSNEQKAARSDFVIWNEFAPDLLPPQVSLLLEKLGLSVP